MRRISFAYCMPSIFLCFEYDRLLFGFHEVYGLIHSEVYYIIILRREWKLSLQFITEKPNRGVVMNKLVNEWNEVFECLFWTKTINHL
jgi:hypothetical protein